MHALPCALAFLGAYLPTTREYSHGGSPAAPALLETVPRLHGAVMSPIPSAAVVGTFPVYTCPVSKSSRRHEFSSG